LLWYFTTPLISSAHELQFGGSDGDSLFYSHNTSWAAPRRLQYPLLKTISIFTAWMDMWFWLLTGRMANSSSLGFGSSLQGLLHGTWALPQHGSCVLRITSQETKQEVQGNFMILEVTAGHLSSQLWSPNVMHNESLSEGSLGCERY
jgi:hypothetical protein